jgi:hypothetical protein
MKTEPSQSCTASVSSVNADTDPARARPPVGEVADDEVVDACTLAGRVGETGQHEGAVVEVHLHTVQAGR